MTTQIRAKKGVSSGTTCLAKLFKNYVFIHNSSMAIETFSSDDPRASLFVEMKEMKKILYYLWSMVLGKNL